MGCLWCEAYKWSDPQPVVYTAGGIDSCIFHAPKDEKQIQVDEFNDLVFKRIEATKQAVAAGVGDQLCNLNGTRFPGNIEFTQFDMDEPLPAISFDSAVFNGDVNFRSATFLGTADFYWTTFAGSAHFENTCFDKKTSFVSTKFCGETVFNGANFSEHADFYHARFSGQTRMASTIFRGYGRFDAAEFSHEVDFESSRWMQASFERARFGGTARFLWAEFSQPIDFSGVFANESALQLHQLSKNSLANLIFKEVDIGYFSLKGCPSWPTALRLESAPYNNFLACEALFRLLKRNAAEEHNQPQVSHWHFREKLMKLAQQKGKAYRTEQLRKYKAGKRRGGVARCWLLAKLKTPIALRSLTWWYSVTSGFGERAVPAFWWLLALLGMSALANATPQPWAWSELPGSSAAQYTMASIPFAKDIPGEGWVKAARGFWQFLIAVQFTLFALAVRNRFRR